MNVSVIMPCWNAGPYLEEAIGSVLEQTHAVRELIVVDDGSTDGSRDVAQAWAKRCGAVRVVTSERAGAAAARNRGALHATGDALMFLDADDVLRRDAVGALVSALGAAPGGIAMCPWARLARGRDGWRHEPASCEPRRPGQHPLSAWLRGWYHPPCAVLWSRDAWQRSGGWDERITVNDDGDIVMRALAMDLPLAIARDGLAWYRRHPQGGSLSARGRTPEGLASRLCVVAKVAQWLHERGGLHRFRSDLAFALGVIARDAGEVDSSLAREAAALARDPHRAVDWRSVPLRSAASVPAVRRSVCPAVSVIIPTFRRPAELPRAIRSVLGQTMDDVEVLVVDDDPRGSAAAVVERVGDARVRCLPRLDDGGVARARNRGLMEARAPFIALLDDDDEWLPTKLARQLDLFDRAGPAVGLIYTGVEVVYATGQRQTLTPRARGDVFHDMLLRNRIEGGGSNVLFRRQIVAQIGFFDPSLPAMEDYDYWLRLTRHHEVDAVDEPLIRYHQALPWGEGQRQSEAQVEHRSRRAVANRRARLQLCLKHEREMRQAGVWHLALADVARRHLALPDPDRMTAARLALRAVRHSPRSREAKRALLDAAAMLIMRGPMRPVTWRLERWWNRRLAARHAAARVAT